MNIDHKLIQIKKSYGQFKNPLTEVDENNIQWKTILEICQNLSKDASILDAGCGDGRYVKALNNIGFTSVIGVDLFDEIADNSINYQKADVSNLPFGHQKFDFIYSISVINYTDDFQSTLSKWMNLLKPEGFIFISGHNKYSIYSFIRVIKKEAFAQKFPHLKHINFYNPVKISNYLKTIGLKIYVKDGFFITWIDKILSNRVSSNFLNKYTPKYLKFNIGYHFIIVARKSKVE